MYSCVVMREMRDSYKRDRESLRWVGFRGREVRGTCRPLQVHCGTHPEGMPDDEVGEGWWSHHM